MDILIYLDGSIQLNKGNDMIKRFAACFILILFSYNISYGQSYECDNNFGDCGTPEQSGGGGGGGGSVLVTNTDLGDTYQHADDYDDDGIEDSSDNCTRISNPDQTDRDGDGIGDACDNCVSVWNSYQKNIDGDDLGDECDEDNDNDGYKDPEDPCPNHFGLTYCLENDTYFESNEIKESNNSISEIVNSDITNKEKEDLIENSESCNNITSNNSFTFLIFAFIMIIIRKKITSKS